LKILIADDQRHTRNGLRVLLRAAMPQPEIWEAADGKAAQELAEEHQPDLVLMDIRMPGMDGLAATRGIRARCPRVKILVVSLHESRSADAIAAGADGFVGKSQSPEVLLARVAEMLAGKVSRPCDCLP
jgi:two-component system, NarL family, invasion response regulator UvrY